MGWDPIGDVVKEVKKDVDSVVSNPIGAAENFLGGMVAGSGVIGLHGIQEGIGELTGANAARGALNQQRDAIQAYQQGQDKLMADEQSRRDTQDLLASREAGAIQNGSIGIIDNRSSAPPQGDGLNSFNPADLYLGGK